MISVAVATKVALTNNICELTLTPVSGSLPAWSPGAHIDIHLPNGLVRQYSLCSDPHEAANHYKIAVLLEPESRGGSAFIHHDIAVSQQLQISAPKNHFGFTPSASHCVFYAAGIGITPMLPMIKTSLTTNQ